MGNNQILSPPQAASVSGVANPAIDLNSSESGAWEFLFDFPENVPLPSAASQDFDFESLADAKWHGVSVPGELAMQGFDIKNNVEYYCRRKINIPEDYRGNHIIIRFEGVYSNARVWIGSKYIRTHKGGFTSWDCDITYFAQAGGSVVLTVGISDLRGSEKGAWNPEGEKATDDPSGAGYYACHNIGGITRDVTLMALPYDHIADLRIETSFDENYVDVDLKITARLKMVSPSAELKIVLLDKNGGAAANADIQIDNPDKKYCLEEARTINLHVRSPLKWDAEHPNLYTLKAVLIVDGSEKETVDEKIGLREIDFGGKKGDKNKVYINGKEIKLRGVCRHDVSPKGGRSTTKEQDYAEILDYKKCNINFIRTSHYPVSRHLLDACDEFGVYVEEENAACWGPVSCPPEQYLNGFEEMFARDKNRACILIWSLANESNWAEAFEMEYEYIREMDRARLVIFSFAHTSPFKFDICSVHYDSWNSKILGDSRAYYKQWKLENLYGHEVPVLHDEYSPPAVHHYSELQKDLGARNFWGECIYRFWDNVFCSDGALGGAIWCAGDEIFFVPENISQFMGPQGHSDGPTAGCGNWGVVHDAYKRPKPEAYLTKKGYSPIRLNEKDFEVSGKNLKIPVKNYYDHTDLCELKILCSVDGKPAEEISPPSVMPHGAGEINIKGEWESAIQANLKFYAKFGGGEMMVDEFNIILKQSERKFEPASPEPPFLSENAETITVSGENFSVVFDKSAAQIQKAEFKNKTLISGGPHFYVADAERGNWSGTVCAEIAGNFAFVTISGEYGDGQGIVFKIKISGNGIIATEYALSTDPPISENLKETGISYDIAPDAEIESVDWQRNAFHGAYPEGHIGRAVGKAAKIRENSEIIQDVYGVEPPWKWEDDMRDFSLYHSGDPNDGIVTNDFKTMRERVWSYNVNFAGGGKIGVESENADIAARIETRADWEQVDDRDPRIAYFGNWIKKDGQICESKNACTENYAYNKTETISYDAGDCCELEFEGTGICFVSAKDSGLGILKAYIDGEFKEAINTRGHWGESKKRVVYAINGLKYGKHKIKIENFIAPVSVDAFGILKKSEPAQKCRLIINNQWYYPDLSWGSYQGVPGSLKKGSSGSATIRLA